MKRIMSIVITILFTLGLTSAALAQEGAADNNLPIPLTMKDLSGKSNVALSVPMLPATDNFGMAPTVSFQYAMEHLNLGVAVPMAVIFPDGGDTTFVLGNPTINALYRYCTQGSWSFCFGGGLDISAGFMEADTPEKLAAHAVGWMSHEDWTSHNPDNLVISPVLTAGVTNGFIIAQAEVGTSVVIPILRTDGRDTEAGLNFAAGGGLRLAKVIVPLIELRGIAPLTQDDKDPYLWMSFGARLELAHFSPMVRVSVPLNDKSKMAAPMDAPVHLEAALAYQF